MLARTLALFVAFTLAPNVRADDATDPESKLKDYLKTIKGAETARVTALTGDGVKETFPDYVLFGVLFPQYPVARVAPAPLKSTNVIAVPKKDGKPVLVTSEKELEAFFKKHAQAVKKPADAEEVARAWLRAAAELHQDGFYKFTIKTGVGTASGETITVSGEAPVDPQGGNKGEVKSTLAFKEGKLATVETKVNLKPGIRPICQATKLLDPDPIVRGMAEQSIRVMGSAAKPYLDEQKAKATPQLREAIDRAWARIIAEGR